MSQQTVTLQLGDSLPIAKGGHRTCYIHPSDEHLCVKVLHEDWRTIDRRLNDPLRAIRRRRQFDENLSEWIELKRLEKKLGPRLKEHFPKAHALVQTDQGEALICDFIRDSDGSPSLTLKHYLWEYGLDATCNAAIDDFWTFLKANKLIVRDPFPHNLLVQRDHETKQIRIIQIDGFGCSDFLPFSRWLTSTRNRKLDGRRRRMDRQIQKHLKAIQEGKQPTGKGVIINQ